MRIINSYDLFDIILGRKINNQIDFFNKCMIKNTLENFVSIRIISEQKANIENSYYNLFHIYKFIQEHYKLSYAKTIEFINLEIETEFENIYPIYENINKLNSDSIITIEHYYNSEQIKKFLSKFNIIDIPIYTSNELNTLKSDGSIYNYLKKFYKIKLHTGANYTLDYEVPNSLKIKANYYEYKYHPIISNIQNNLKDTTKEYFKMIELGCINIEDQNVWNLQLYYNLPILLLFCNTILNFCIEKNISNVIFLSRNCTMLKKFFDNLSKNNSINTSELVISFKLLENKNYLKKLLTHFNKLEKYIFIDFNDCFTIYLNNFFKIGFQNEPYFYNIFNNRFSSTTQINCYSLFTNDFESTKIMELLNLPNIGHPFDYNNETDTIIYDNLEFNQNLINIYSSFVNLVIDTIDLTIIDNIIQKFVSTIIDNLTKIKLIINNLQQYNELKTIFNTIGDDCIKIDYNDPNYINNLDRYGKLNPYLKSIKK
jgi:predicted HAD superfamily hydrolase